MRRYDHAVICGLMMVLALGAASLAQYTPSAGQPSKQPAGQAPKQILSAARERAIQQVLDASRSEDAILRANAIEAMQPLPDRVAPLVQLGLQDPEPVVRFAALVTIGKLEMASLGPAARRLMDDPSPSVRAAAMYAARASGLDVDISGLAGMLASPDPGLRGNVAMLLGMMGDPSAVPMMIDLAGAPMPLAGAERTALVRLQIAEALVRLGHNEALDAVRAGAYSTYGEVRVLAVLSMGKLNDRRMEVAIRYLLADPPIELQLAAAEALARMGSDAGLEVMLEGAASRLAPARAQAAFGLGLIPRPKAAQALVGLLGDPDEQVRLSAAASILQATK